MYAIRDGMSLIHGFMHAVCDGMKPIHGWHPCDVASDSIDRATSGCVQLAPHAAGQTNASVKPGTSADSHWA